MPGVDGIEATRQLTSPGTARARTCPPRIVILTTFDLDEYVYDALRAGGQRLPAQGRHRRAALPRRAGHRGRRGAACPDRDPPPHQRVRQGSGPPGRIARAPPGLAALTPRETQVLRLVAEGLSNPEIAARFTVTDETVEMHVSRILREAGAGVTGRRPWSPPTKRAWSFPGSRESV